MPKPELARPSRALKAAVVGAHDSMGGAARATYRVFDALSQWDPDRLDTFFRAIHKTVDNPRVLGGKPSRNRVEYAAYYARTRFRKYAPRKPFVSPNTLLHSQALYHSGLGRELNSGPWDVLLLNWLGNATLSVPEIGRLKAPVVWLLHDMWMFSGAEHYSETYRHRAGYSRSSRPLEESGPDIDRETFRRKKRNWRTPQHIICPSTWMASEAGKSELTRNWPIHVIPYPIDLTKWQARSRRQARELFGFPHDAIVVLSGIGGGTKFRHKGADLFFDALPFVAERLRSLGDKRKIVAAFFGQDGAPENHGDVSVRFLGRLDDDGVVNAYSAADVMVVPSRQDNFPSTGTEPQVAGCPVVAFDASGLSDIVDDGVTGRLATPFESASLGQAISWVVEDPERRDRLAVAARARAEKLWEPRAIAQRYAEVLIAAALEGKKR